MGKQIESNDIKRLAEGRWLEVFASLAPELAPAMARLGRHVACPVHGGSDGFRLFKDAPRTGGGICNTCGAAHDGLGLLMWLKDWRFPRVLEEVDAVLRGSTAPVRPRATRPVVQIREPGARDGWNTASRTARRGLRARWREATPLRAPAAKRLVAAYLRGRRIDPARAMHALGREARIHPALPYLDGDGQCLGRWPALLTVVRDARGRAVTVHRTYLEERSDGTVGKAPVPKPKKLYPIAEGEQLSGGAIRLGKPRAGVLGVTEGLETALAVTEATGLPTWPTLSASLLGVFAPPEGVHTVVVWADRDRPADNGKAAGLQAARILQQRLWSQGIRVAIRLPEMEVPSFAKSVDWADVLALWGPDGFPKTTRRRTAA